jgi:predicted aminopeptidase
VTLLRSLIAIGLAAGLSGCYVTRQALHQNELFNTRRSIDEVAADPATPEKTRAKLATLDTIMAFATAEGLNAAGAYRYYIDTKEPVVSYLVSAAEPDQLKAVTWWFPVVGSVPYLGFFKKTERDEKAAELRASGYDVHEAAAGAFSSLGWFEDPLFTSMLNRSDADLAHLMFHELTHRTLWVAGSTEFNENLAEYVAMVMTREFLAARPVDLDKYEKKRQDRKLFRAWLGRLKAALEALYAQRGTMEREALMSAKRDVFARFTKAPEKPKFALVDYVEDEDWNNSAVLSASLYAPDLDRFAAAHGCLAKNAPIKAFLAALAAAAEDHDDGFTALDALCQSPAILGPSSTP